MMRTDPGPRGFTLVEMAIAIGVSALVVASTMVLMVAHQRSFRSGSDDRALQEIARIALGRLSADLRSAGFGVDPPLAFDFGRLQNVRIKQAPEGVVFNTQAFHCGAGPACRDRTDGPDEIVFLSRDPVFAKPLREAATADQLVVAGPLTVPLHAGQILQVMCFTGPMTWAYVTVAEEVEESTALSVTIPINTESTTYDFPTQNQSLTDACFGAHMTVDPDPPYPPGSEELAGAAKVFKVDRYRYFVQRYGSRPYLMLDRGGPTDEVIAPDVEDIQFSYLFPNAPANQLVGADPGTQLANDATGIELAPETGFPVYGDDLTALTQTNHQSGNIRGVRISIVVRAPLADSTHPEEVVIPAAANRAALNGDAGYRRLLVETTVATPNLAARAPYFPTYGSADAFLNVGGG